MFSSCKDYQNGEPNANWPIMTGSRRSYHGCTFLKHQRKKCFQGEGISIETHLQYGQSVVLPCWDGGDEPVQLSVEVKSLGNGECGKST